MPLPYDREEVARRREAVEEILIQFAITSVEDLVYHMAANRKGIWSLKQMRDDLRFLRATKVRNWHGDKRTRDYGKLCYKVGQRGEVDTSDNPAYRNLVEYDVEQDAPLSSQPFRGRLGSVKLPFRGR